eukprot:COSAG01_NODE_5299_length_4352_cov_2.254879_5_plen_112_part_00
MHVTLHDGGGRVSEHFTYAEHVVGVTARVPACTAVQGWPTVTYFVIAGGSHNIQYGLHMTFHAPCLGLGSCQTLALVDAHLRVVRRPVRRKPEPNTHITMGYAWVLPSSRV